jgi:large subunit ribosomal protein L24
VKAGEKILVEGVNMITKYERKTQENPEGGSVEKEAPIHYSNVMLAEKYDAKSK